MYRNNILHIMLIPMLLPEVIIKPILIPLLRMPIRPYPPRLPRRALWVRIFERVDEEFERKAADAADARAQREAERADYDEDGDGDCWKGDGRLVGGG